MKKPHSPPFGDPNQSFTIAEQKEIGTYDLFELINKARNSIKKTTITDRLKEIEEEYVLDKIKPTECEMDILRYRILGLLKEETDNK